MEAFSTASTFAFETDRQPETAFYEYFIKGSTDVMHRLEMYVHEFAPTLMSGPTGAFPTRSQLTLPPVQRRLLKAVADTGTPTILITIAGRPLTIVDESLLADAVLLGFYPGAQAGRAIAEIILGETNPTGKLPISVPRSIGHLPTVHDYCPSPQPFGGDNHPDPYDPLFPFGHGLSYTDFEYESISYSTMEIASDDNLEVTVTVTNRGNRTGTEVVQLYLRDVVSSRVTPVRELVRFDRVTVLPGERRHVSFTLTPADLGVVHPDGRSDVEPGKFEVMSGDCSTEFLVTE